MKHLSRHAGWWAGWILLGLGLAVSSMAVAEGGRGSGSAPAFGSASARPHVGYAPDPPAIRSASQWLLTFEYQRGKVKLLEARRVQLRQPITTARRMGRYAVELLSGPTVVERVRFEFPLIGADELAGQHRPYNAPLHFEGKATVTHRILLPDTPRAARARLVDRATGESFMIPWPPVVAQAAVPPKRVPDAGGDSAVEASPEAGPDGAKPDAAKEPDAAKKPDAGRDGGARRDAGAPDAIVLEP